MIANHPLAEAITKEAIGEFGRWVFNKNFYTKHGAMMSNVPRFYAAAFSTLENAINHYIENRTDADRKPEIQQAIRASFAAKAHGLSAGVLLLVSLEGIVVAPFEREAVEKNFRRMGHQGSLEALMTYPTSFGSHFQAIQDIRCAEFVGFLVSSPDQNLKTALRLSFSFWFFGKHTPQSDEMSLVIEIADSAEWAATLTIEKILGGQLPSR